MKTESPFGSTPPFGQGEPTLRVFIKLNAQVLGITLGILCGLALFIATNVLVLKGGPNPGAHLQLLGQFFYGYKVSFVGSLIGASYAFIVGYVAGGIIALIYGGVNHLHSR
jgi:hypothetical protein